MPAEWEHQDIIRVIEGVHCAKGPKSCSKCIDAGITRRLCLIRIYRNADSTPRPIIEIPEKEQVYFPYDVLRCFDNVKDAHDYAEKHGIIHVEY